jgi:formylglycine-generating enzyme required for sulfatase activity/tRNA A-37 threonylcarbamoyl transferase component Bud32
MDLHDAVIGQYRISKQIGRGGMATVYKAYQPNLDRYVAVKVLAPDRVETNFTTRFELEARAIAKLRHRNILTIFDYGRQGDMFYLAMEYVSGGTLKERLGWPQDLTYAVSIISQVGDALAYAHRQGMVHRDVKPANILMAEEDWPLLSDFGLAKVLEDSLQLTVSGASIGTPQYMSPEQAQGLSVDQRSDIYSLGVVLYEMVTGRPPFGTDSPVAIILRHINEPITPPNTLRSDVPEALEQVILKSLAKSPDDRYQRMEEFLDDLHEAYPLPDSRNVVLHQGNAQAGSQGSPAALRPVPGSSATPLTRRRRSFPWARLIIGIILLLTLALASLHFRDSMTLLVSTFLTEVVAAAPSLLATNTVAPSPAATDAPTVAPSPAATDASTATPSPSPAPPSPTATPTAPPPQPIEVKVWEADGAEMVLVPAGEFIMGSEELGEDEQPVHPVYLDDFWIDRYEVTNELFARFVAETGYQTEAERLGWGWVSIGSEWAEVEGADWRHPRGPDSSIEGKMDHPVVLVSWNDADAYCRWAGKRLPSEAQWEKAARGSSDSEFEQRYAWGDEFDSTKANTKELGLGDTTPAGNFSPQGDSPFGVSDMTGNVWEWVADWYAGDYYSQAPSANPSGPITGTYKVLRGGSWLFDEVYARIAFRYNVRPDYTYDFAGFRCSSQ